MKHYFTWGLVPIILFGTLAFFFWRGLSLDPQSLPSVHIDKSLPAFCLKTLEGEGFFSPKTMRGQPAVLHVWASWCTTCAEEQVFLLSLAQSGVVIYGLNYKDAFDDARQWLDIWGNPYRLNGRDTDGHVAIDLGVYGTPETFLIDKEGVIRYRHVGALNQTIWERVMLPKWRMLMEEVA